MKPFRNARYMFVSWYFCSMTPRNGSWEPSLMRPGGAIQAGRWMGLVSPEISSLRSWTSMGFANPQRRLARDDVHSHSRWWKIRQQVSPKNINDTETMPAHWYARKCIRHRMGARPGARYLRKSIQLIRNLLRVFFLVHFSFPSSKACILKKYWRPLYRLHCIGISGIHTNSDEIPWKNPQWSITIRVFISSWFGCSGFWHCLTLWTCFWLLFGLLQSGS